MKKWLVACLLFCTAIAAFRIILNFYPWRIGEAIDLAAALGAKLACSAYFISGQSQEQVMSDLASYSPATQLLELTYERNKVTANMLHIATQSATFRKDIGCTLDIGDTETLDALTIARPLPSDDNWPKGKTVNTIKSDRQQVLDEVLQQDNERGLQTRALLMIQDGEIVAESYAKGLSENTMLLSWSMAKSLTAIMIGRMQQLGLLHIGDVSGLPQWQDDERATITIEQLLQMRSGLQFDETYTPGSDSTRMLFSAYSASDVALKARLGHAPGEHFSYSSGTTNILARLIHDKSGGSQAMLDFFAAEILQPLNMSHTILELDPSGVFVGSSYIYATARDWGRVGLLMLNKGRLNGEQWLPSEWVSQAAKPIDTEKYGKYGYQFWLNSDGEEVRWPNLPEDSFMMMGNRKQIMMMIPSHNTVIVRLGWTSGHYPTEENFVALLSQFPQ
ncbi:MAG: serine hydrolase domain-containing protein [Aestuariibacter sp.]